MQAVRRRSRNEDEEEAARCINEEMKSASEARMELGAEIYSALQAIRGKEGE